MDINDKITTAMSQAMNILEKAGLKVILIADSKEIKATLIASNINNEIEEKYMTEKLVDSFMDVRAVIHERKTEVPQSIQSAVQCLMIAPGVAFQIIKDQNSYVNKFMRFMDGDTTGLTQEEINEFLDKGYCPNPDGKKPEVKSIGDNESNINLN